MRILGIIDGGVRDPRAQAFSDGIRVSARSPDFGIPYGRGAIDSISDSTSTSQKGDSL